MIDQREIIWGIVAPPVLMAIGMAVTAHMPVARRFLATGALLALVFGLCHLGFRGWKMPGTDVNAWVAWIAVTGGLLTMCSMCGQGPLLWRILTRAALTGVSTWLLLRPYLAQIGSGEATLWVGGLTAAWTATILAWERVHAATTQGVSVTTLASLAGFSSLCLLMFNVMEHAQYAGILMGALVAAAVLSWWRPSWYSAPGPVTVSAVVLPMVWVLGERYASLPFWALPVLAVAGLAPLAVTVSRLRSLAAWKRIAITQVVLVALVSPVVIAGIRLTIQMLNEPGYGY